MTRITQEISLIQEYRTRLIADVVTGQVDVRELAARLTPSATDEADLEAELLLAAEPEMEEELEASTEDNG